MLWLALHLPLLSLEAFCATLPPGAPRRPVALIGQQRIIAVDSAAAEARHPARHETRHRAGADGRPAAGRRPGCPRRRSAAGGGACGAGLHSCRDVARYADRVAGSAGQPSPVRRLGALHRRLLDALAPLGHRLQTAAAPTALGAALLSQWHPVDRGDPVHGGHASLCRPCSACWPTPPVWMLGPGREHWEALQGMGLHTLSDLRQLPRAGLARRFGAGLLDDLDRALGLQPDRDPGSPCRRSSTAASSFSPAPKPASRCWPVRPCCWRGWWPGRWRGRRE